MDLSTNAFLTTAIGLIAFWQLYRKIQNGRIGNCRWSLWCICLMCTLLLRLLSPSLNYLCFDLHAYLSSYICGWLPHVTIARHRRHALTLVLWSWLEKLEHSLLSGFLSLLYIYLQFDGPYLNCTLDSFHAGWFHPSVINFPWIFRSAEAAKTT